MNIHEAIEFINSMQSYQEGQAARHAAQKNRAAGHLDRAAKLEQVAALLSELSAGCSMAEQPKGNLSLNLSPSDLRGLPEELLAQLSVTQSDFLDFQIVDLIDDAGGAMSLDQLIIALYRKTGSIQERSKLNSRLYRMSKKGLVKSIEGRKGVYATREVVLDDSLEDDHGEETSP